MLVFLTIFLPKKISEKIDTERAKYDPAYKRLAPHITIIPPFEPAKELEPALNDIRKALKNIESFYVELNGIGTFNKLSNSAIFVDVVDGQALKELQKTIFYILEDCGARLGKYRYVPNFHVTIAKKLKLPSLLKIYAKLRNFRVNESFLIEKISVCTIEKNEPWQLKEEVYLKTPKE